jgi:hypothetical protein
MGNAANVRSVAGHRLAVLLSAVVLPVLALVHAGPARAAGGAFAVDDSEIGKPGECKVESWASFADSRDFVGVVSPACVVNIIRPIELGAQLSRFRADDEWGTSLTLKGKTNFIPAETGKFGIGLVGGTMFDLVTRENTGAFINVPVTFPLSEQFKINVNGGWLYDRVAALHWATYGAGFEWNFVKPLTLIGEVFGQAGQNVLDQPTLTDPRAQLGLRYTPVESLDIDIIYGRNITGAGANWITAGLNVRFGGTPEPAAAPKVRLPRK